MRLCCGIMLVGYAACATGVWAQSVTEPAIASSPPTTQTWQFGLVIRSPHGPCRNILAYAPIPKDWPEQQVRIIATDKSSNVGRSSFKDLGLGARQWMVQVPQLQAGESARAVLTVEVTKQAQTPPADVARLVAPARPSGSLRSYLAPSPLIESSHARIRQAARQAVTDAPDDWSKVESIYDWVRTTIQYKNGGLKGALAALDDGTGDCEELTSLFIAMCRSQRIPARTVWIPGHCYPEFYLSDAQGNGNWYPCQAAGDRAFGRMLESRPILQKGDNFRLPGMNQPQRYAQPVATSENRPGLVAPEIEYIRQRVDHP